MGLGRARSVRGMAAWAALWLAASVGAGGADADTGWLKVTVVGDEGVVPGASISVGDGADVAVAGDDGTHVFALAPGLHTVRASTADRVGTVSADVVAGRVTGVIVALALAPVAADPETSATLSGASGDEAEMVVVESTTTGMVLTKEFLTRIPAGRSYSASSVAVIEAEVDGAPRKVKRARTEASLSTSAPPDAPRPGPPLRAGSTDDNAKFDAYLAFYREWTDRDDVVGQYEKIDVRGRRYVDVVGVHGRAVVGAEVHVVDERTGEVVWVATTGGDGRVPFYPHLDGDAPLGGGSYTLQVDGAPAHSGWTGREDVELVVDDAEPLASGAPVDVVLILDTTGSMSDELAQIQASLLGVTRRLALLRPAADLQVGLVLYRDRGDTYVTRVSPLTADLARIDAELREASADGGGDTPESLNAALADAVDLAFRPEAAKLAFLVADAPPHLDYRGDASYADSVRDAVAVGLKVHTVAASGLDPAGSLVFRQIAQFTRGRFVFVEYGGDVVASGRAHGVEAQQLAANNLDAILYDLVRLEVEGYGR